MLAPLMMIQYMNVQMMPPRLMIKNAVVFRMWIEKAYILPQNDPPTQGFADIINKLRGAIFFNFINILLFFFFFSNFCWLFYLIFLKILILLKITSRPFSRKKVRRISLKTIIMKILNRLKCIKSPYGKEALRPIRYWRPRRDKIFPISPRIEIGSILDLLSRIQIALYLPKFELL